MKKNIFRSNDVLVVKGSGYKNIGFAIEAKDSRKVEAFFEINPKENRSESNISELKRFLEDEIQSLCILRGVDNNGSVIMRRITSSLSEDDEYEVSVDAGADELRIIFLDVDGVFIKTMTSIFEASQRSFDEWFSFLDPHVECLD